MKKQRSLYPVFKSKVKAIDTYKNFVQGTTYEIVGFGTDKKQGDKYIVWFMQDVDYEYEQFSVVKTTLNALIDRKILVEVNE